MRSIIYLLLFWLSATTVHAQGLNKYLKERAEKNLQYLAKDPTIKNSVVIDDSGIHIKNFSTNRTDLSVYWSEIPHVISLLENSPYYEMVEKFKNKNTQSFKNISFSGPVEHYRNFPDSYDGLYVAIDPGHFGGTKDEAQMEGRIVKMKGEDLGISSDISFFESDLNYTTALMLKEYLVSKGAMVMITRPYNAGALGMNFKTWLKDIKGFQKDVIQSRNLGDISADYQTRLKTAYTDTTKIINRNELFGFYKFLDFKERANKINEFRPNITVAIHYNAAEGNKFYGDRYLHPVTENYSMAFTPGAFMHGEVSKIDQKLDFIRLLLSPDLENSMQLADLVLDEHQKLLGVGRGNVLANDKMDKVTLPTPYDGVLCRNLVLTRMVRGTIVYGESLLQDNIEEALALSKKDIKVWDENFGLIPTSKRCQEVSQAYATAIDRFLELNKKKSEEIKSLQANLK